jgi:soluble lytic murein transglycosylase-like protein
VDEQRKRRDFVVHALGGVLAIVVAAGAIAAIALALGLGEREPVDVRVEGITAHAKRAARKPAADPFAYQPSRRGQFERRAALAASHVIYEMSPGGVVASARRTAEFRDQIEAAATAHGVDPDLLEAIIFLESAGRPQISAGPTPEAASGLAQILPSTATDLLGMQVDLPASIELTRRIRRANDEAKVERLLAERARIDERFDPAQALDGAARYLEIATQRFGDPQLAVVSYHMGIGNLESVLRAYADVRDSVPIAQVVASRRLAYAEVYFESSPGRDGDAYGLLTGFGDESSDYLWKVTASEEIVRRARDDPEGLADTARLATAKATLEEVFHPLSETDVFEDAGEIEDAIDDGDLVPLPDDPSLGWVPAKQLGELAPELDTEPALYRVLRPEALAALSYLAGTVRDLSGAKHPLKVTSATRSREYQELLIGINPEATSEYSLHTTGWSFDIKRKYGSPDQERAFQYALDHLRSLALLDYAIEPGAMHVTVSGEGEELIR